MGRRSARPAPGRAQTGWARLDASHHRYCSTDCQRVDWRERGHRKACKKIRKERATEAARAEAPTPPLSPPVYGPAPRSHADEVRARIAAEHEAARARREANPVPEPESARYGSRCPICLDEWDVNVSPVLRVCCCRLTCASCSGKIGFEPCPLCRAPFYGKEGFLSGLRRHIDNDVPEAMQFLGDYYKNGDSYYSIVKSSKKAAKLYRRAAELGNVRAMTELGTFYINGDGVKMDKRKGMALTRMASDRGFAMAQHNLAVQLAKDSGVFGVTFMHAAENHNKVLWTEIIRLYRLAAEQGYTGSENNLGNCYARGGSGFDQDIDEAVFWYRRAARKGHKNASSVLTQLGIDHIKGQAPSNPSTLMRETRDRWRVV